MNKSTQETSYCSDLEDMLFSEEERFGWIKPGARIYIPEYDGQIVEGKTGTVIGYPSDFDHLAYDTLIPVEFDEYVGGHTCQKLGKKGHCYYIVASHIEKEDKK